jgi:hypothetical protein
MPENGDLSGYEVRPHSVIDNNTVERPIALNRENALFAGSDGGAEHWATIAS